MLLLANDELAVDLLDPANAAERRHQGARFCWGGYIWRVRDVKAGDLLAGPEWPRKDPRPFNGQGAPESFRHAAWPTQRPLTLVDGRGFILGAGDETSGSEGSPLDDRPCPWEISDGDGILGIPAPGRPRGLGMRACPQRVAQGPHADLRLAAGQHGKPFAAAAVVCPPILRIGRRGPRVRPSSGLWLRGKPRFCPGSRRPPHIQAALCGRRRRALSAFADCPWAAPEGRRYPIRPLSSCDSPPTLSPTSVPYGATGTPGRSSRIHHRRPCARGEPGAGPCGRSLGQGSRRRSGILPLPGRGGTRLRFAPPGKRLRYYPIPRYLFLPSTRAFIFASAMERFSIQNPQSG